MKQRSFDSGFELIGKRTRKREFLDEMERVVFWGELVALIELHQPFSGNVRPAFAIETMLRIHFLQQWFNLSDPVMEEALHDDSTILCFWNLLETNHLDLPILAIVNAILSEKRLLLRQGTVADATLIAVSSSTKNQDGVRDLEKHQSKKGKLELTVVQQIDQIHQI